MRLNTEIESRWRNRLKRIAGGVATIGMVSAVAVAGLVLLGSEAFASWKNLGSGENPTQGFWAFAAPASTLAQFQAKTKDAQVKKEQVNVLLAKNWRNTALTESQFDGLRNLLIFSEIVTGNMFQENGLGNPLSMLLLTNYQTTFNQMFDQLNPALSPTHAQFASAQSLLTLFQIVSTAALGQNGLDQQNLMEYVLFQFAFNQMFNQLDPPLTPNASPSS